MTITRVTNFYAAKEKEEELFKLLNSIMPYINNSEGCNDAQLLESSDETGHFVVIEQWQSIEHHQQSVANFPKEKMQSAMTLMDKPPQGGYFK